MIWKGRVKVVEGGREALRVKGEKFSRLILFNSQFIPGAILGWQQSNINIFSSYYFGGALTIS